MLKLSYSFSHKSVLQIESEKKNVLSLGSIFVKYLYLFAYAFILEFGTSYKHSPDKGH